MKQILFVCLGNICRSPAAEAIMTALVEEAGLSEQIICDSAGTIGYHSGNPADSRMRHAASQRGYAVTSISRQVKSSDFKTFDYIVAMDDSNVRNLWRMDENGQYRDKIVKMTDFCSRLKASEVPDPYYGSGDGFERVLDILEDACSGLLDEVTSTKMV